MTKQRTGEMPTRLWTVDETAMFLSIPVATLYKLNHKGTGPRFFRVGRGCRYDPRDILEWLQSKVVVQGNAF
jgi:predicted DNA-binding transcriptional regulator AlpA